MRIIEIVASITNETHGPSYSVPQLAAAVAREGAEVELHTVGPPQDIQIHRVRLRTFGHDLSAVPPISHLRMSRGMRAALQQEAQYADVLHTHGLWLAPNVYPAKAARAAGKTFVLSPRGMLGAAALQYSAVKKHAFWIAFQRRAVQSATMLHATSQGEFEDIRAYGLTNPVAIISNGVEVPAMITETSQGQRTVLSLGRVHPKKGLDRLLRAWALLGPVADGWRLRIVGPSELGHAAELAALAASHNLSGVTIEGPLFGADKLAAYRQADLFVLASLNENFAMTVAEALAAGTPVISTKGAPWAGLETERCGWWVDHGPEPMAAALKVAMSNSPEALAVMGARGHDWMQRDYSWDRIGREMLEAYRWAARGGRAPPTVRV